jgi:hypothetical protein
VRWSGQTDQIVGGRRELADEAPFAWREGGRLRYYQSGASHWINGRDGSSSEFCVRCSDARAECRVYRMTQARGTWRIRRDAPGSKQRFEGKCANGSEPSRGEWERSTDGRA